MLRTDTRTHRCRSLPRDVAILRSSSVLGQAVVQSPAPLSTPFGRAPRRSMAIEHRFLRPSRVARLPHAASPPPGVDEEPYPGLPCSPCACASCCPRDPEVTPPEFPKSAHARHILLAEEVPTARSRRRSQRAPATRCEMAYAMSHMGTDPEGSAGSSLAVLATSGRLADPRAPRTTIARVTPVRVRKAAVFHGVSCPSTHADGGSDSCRGCLPRLRGVHGLPRPLDALLRSQPLRPCFMPVAPLGFSLSEGFPLQ